MRPQRTWDVEGALRSLLNSSDDPVAPTLSIRNVGAIMMMSTITCHLRPKFTILCRPLLHAANAPYPIRLFSTRSLRWLPLLSQRRVPCRPSTIKTKASESQLKRLETCETADHYPPVQFLFVCTISLFPPREPHFHDRLPRSQESRSPPPALEPSPSTSPIPPTDLTDDANSVDFVARVSTIPLVNTALRAYEQTKASSKVVKVLFFSSLRPPPPPPPRSHVYV